MRAPPGLHALARLHGIQTAYYDNDKRRVTASPAALAAALRALGVHGVEAGAIPEALARRRRALLERAVEPVVVVWLPESRPSFPFTLPAGDVEIRVTVGMEDGGEATAAHRASELEVVDETSLDGRDYATFQVPMPRLPAGYHRLQVETTRPGRRFESLLLAAPRRASGWEVLPGGPDWGVFAPLYSLWEDQTPDRIPHFGLLERLAAGVTELGGSVVGTLPLLAAFLDDPYEPSPYAPVSRLFWNELYVDAGDHDAVGKSFHRGRALVLRRRALEDEARGLFGGSLEEAKELPPALASFTARNHRALDYARFRALTEARGPWPDWPDRLRARDVRPGDYDESVARYHLYAQWRADEELARTEEQAASMGCALYLDLPLGVDPRGYDVWREREQFVLGATAGAPPDPMAPHGQNWGFHPLHPERSRREGHRYFRDAVRTHLRFARVLRIDHVMQLHRLFILPEGSGEGVYVRYPHEELYAILCLESHRAGSVVVGEDLGTVPGAVRKGMRRHGIPGTYVVQFELRETDVGGEAALEPRRIPQGALAGVGTHDTPTFAAWWTGRDAEIRRDRGLMDPEEAEGVEQGRGDLREKLARGLGVAEDGETDDLLDPEGAGARTLEALHRFLGASGAGLALASLEDVWLDTEPQNVPGTPAEDNWKGRARRPVEALTEGSPRRLLEALNNAREGTA